MKRGPNLSLDLFGDRLVLPEQADDGGEHRRILRVLREAERGELTERQRECVRLYYGEGKNVNEIAESLGITAPTVSKHLKKARARLSRILSYYFPKMNR